MIDKPISITVCFDQERSSRILMSAVLKMRKTYGKGSRKIAKRAAKRICNCASLKDDTKYTVSITGTLETSI